MIYDLKLLQSSTVGGKNRQGGRRALLVRLNKSGFKIFKTINFANVLYAQNMFVLLTNTECEQ